MYLAVTDRSVRTLRNVEPEHSGEVFAALINLSGRRRFTSQRVVLYAVLAANGHAGSLETAADALAMFKEAHTTLVKGNKDLPGVFGMPLRDAYFGALRGDEKIQEFIALADRALFAIQSGWQRQIPVLLAQLVEASTALLGTLNSLTTIHEQEARTHAQQMEQQLKGAMQEIKTISKQALVVAMNARIAAARAGSAGREFAVVATELIAITTDIETILHGAMARTN